jgi:hypothetical protein
MHAEQKTLFDTGYQTYLGLRRREVAEPDAARFLSEAMG